jgi:hypothetical protein
LHNNGRGGGMWHHSWDRRDHVTPTSIHVTLYIYISPLFFHMG